MRRQTPFPSGPLAVTLSILILAQPARSLERTSVRGDVFAQEGWSGGQSCTVRYYNNCTGWVWAWNEWSPGEQLGTAFHTCCQQAVLHLTNMLTFSGAPSGWGFTGTMEVFDAQGGECPSGAPLSHQAWAPPVASGWSSQLWNVPVPQDFLVRITWSVPTGFLNLTGLASDHPAAGPTGPQACGTCFPTDRVGHSFYYGPPGQRYCPGVTLDDGACDVEWALDAVLSCPVHTEESSWGQIKTLYR